MPLRAVAPLAPPLVRHCPDIIIAMHIQELYCNSDKIECYLICSCIHMIWQLERRVAIFLHDLLFGQQKEYLNAEQATNVEALVRIMEVCGLNVIPPPPNTIDEWAMISEVSYFLW